MDKLVYLRVVPQELGQLFRPLGWLDDTIIEWFDLPILQETIQVKHLTKIERREDHGGGKSKDGSSKEHTSSCYSMNQIDLTLNTATSMQVEGQLVKALY